MNDTLRQAHDAANAKLEAGPAFVTYEKRNGVPCVVLTRAAYDKLVQDSAAAPEMLGALQEMLALAMLLGANTQDVATVREVIAKAQGHD